MDVSAVEGVSVGASDSERVLAENSTTDNNTTSTKTHINNNISSSSTRLRPSSSSGVRGKPNGVRAASKAKGDVRALDLMLRHFNIDFLTQILLQNDYTYENLHEITESDLTKLRITNKGHRHSVLLTAKELEKELSMAPEERTRRKLERVNGAVTQSLGFATRSRIEAAKRRDRMEAQTITSASSTGGGGDISVPPEDASGYFSENTATIQTANEHARCAQIYLEHHRIDRAWPRPRSKLSQTLHLSGASAPDTGKPLYSVIDSSTGAKKVINPPCKHNQGYSSKFCRTCAEFVSQSMAGQWQFQTLQKVVIGDGEVEYVPVWKAFKESDNLAIEYAKKRNNPSIKVRGKIVDFDALQWGDKPVRRVDADVVPFPTLSKRDIIRPRCAMSSAEGGTGDEMEAAEREAAEQIRALQRKLVTDTEEMRSRLMIEQEEQMDLRNVLADIAIIMDDYHTDQRADLEVEEEEARAVFEGKEYLDALEKLNEWEEESVRGVAIKKWTNDCNAIYAKQWGVVELMEEKRRAEVEEIEEASRANLEKLMAAFNAQVRALQAKQRKATSKAIKEIESGLRCHVCRRRNCVFHKQPWKAHWKTQGGALDLHPFDPTINANLSVLMGTATEHEWLEAKMTDQTERRDKKAKSRMHIMLSDTSHSSRRIDHHLPQTEGVSVDYPIGDLSHISYSSNTAANDAAHQPMMADGDGQEEGGTTSPARPQTAFASSRGLPGVGDTSIDASRISSKMMRPASAASTIRAAVRISRAESSRNSSRAGSPHHDKPFYSSCTNPSSHRCMPDTVSRNTKVTARQS